MHTSHTHVSGGGGGSCRGGGTWCRNCLKKLPSPMFSCFRFAPTVSAGSREARKYDPLLLRGNVRFVPTMCVLEASDTTRCVLWTACSEYRLNPRPGTYATSINVIIWSVFPCKIRSIFPIDSTLIFRRSPILIVSRLGGGGLKLCSICPIVSHVARRAAVGNPNINLTAARLHYGRLHYRARRLLGRNGRSMWLRRHGG